MLASELVYHLVCMYG